MSPSLRACCWPLAGAGEALTVLAHALTGDAPGESPVVMPSTYLDDDRALQEWLNAAAASLRVEATPFRPSYAKLCETIVRAGPTLLRVSDGAEHFVVAIVRANDAYAHVLAPDGASRRVPLDHVRAALCSGLDDAAEERVERLLDRSAVSSARRARAASSLLAEHFGARLIDAGWTVALPPSATFTRQMKSARLPARTIGVVLLHAIAQALALGAWWLIGRGALEGRLHAGWLIAWALLLATVIPFRVIASWCQGAVALDLSVLIKRRLLFGALRLEPEETRKQGPGQLLGRVIELEAVEALVTTGGLTSLLAVIQLAIAGAVMACGPSGAVSALTFAAVVATTAGLSWIYARRLRAWTGSRLTMTNDLVERMIGHRTRLAQEPRQAWHETEDAQLTVYAERSASLDRIAATLAMVPRAWLVIGLLCLASGFVDGTRPVTALAVGIGGVLMASRGLGMLTAGASALLGANVAWAQARSLFEAGSREEPIVRATPSATTSMHARTLVEARDVSFRYRSAGHPVLRNLDVRIRTRDRLLLQGPSGGGKSTLGAILTGARAPDSGLLLLEGLDRHTLGPRAWRQRVAAAPQFHENYVLSGTFAFNLLMGRSLPLRDADFAAAEEVCRELGLGPLLDRMPSGLMQMVGETGWQLSHGERSRLFIARALLQNAEMIVLDESFAALDPETLERALRCVLARAPTLLVIAHP